MVHRIVIVGAGYAGASAATTLARRTQHLDVRITVFDEGEFFVERVRLHQLATGQSVRRHSLKRLLRRRGIDDYVGESVTTVDADRRIVSSSSTTRAYDTLVYALGSGRADTSTVPGVSAHACFVGTPAEAGRTSRRLKNLRTGSVVVVGGGLTGIETATEIAEARPELDVHLYSSTIPGHRLSRAAREYLHRAFDRMDLTAHVDTVTRVDSDSIELSDTATIASDLTVWTAGFSVPAVARTSGIDVDSEGRILVDRYLRSRSHPEIYAVGDAAAASVANGTTSRMSCQSALPMGRYAAVAIHRELSGLPIEPHMVRYYGQTISLGRHDGITQFTRSDDSPVPFVLTGRASAVAKELVTRGAAAFATRSRF